MPESRHLSDSNSKEQEESRHLPPRRSRKRQKAKGKKDVVYNLLILLCIAVIAYSAYQLFLIYNEYRKADVSYDQIIDKVANEPTIKGDDSYPDIDFDALREINPEVLGWIYIPNTQVNYPVVEGRDNVYYLNHLFDGSPSKNGAIFLDMNNDTSFSDENSVLHGHHMKNGSMFAEIEKYKKQEFFDENPRGYLILPDAVFRIEFFAGVVSKPGELPINFGSLDEKIAWVDDVKGRSSFKADTFEISEETRFISLSTCDYTINDGRYMLSGKLVELER